MLAVLCYSIALPIIGAPYTDTSSEIPRLDLGLALVFDTVMLARSFYDMPPAADRAGELPVLLGSHLAKDTTLTYSC